MNKKKRIALIVTIILVILAIIAGVTCAIVYGSNNHIYEEVVAEEYLKSEATCTKKAVYYKSCECGKVSDETFEYGEPLGHDYGTLIAEDPATCTESGVKAHYHCSRCAKDFDDSKQEITVAELVIPAKGHDYGTWIDGKPATETDNGEKGHYHCPDCGKNFDNDDGKTEIEDIVIPPVVHVHTWGTVTYSWTGTTSCTATRVCVDDATHIETANATVTPQVMQNQTCELPELTTYTATFDEDWCVTQTLENVKTQEKLGHSYTNYVSDGNATCTTDGTKTATCDHSGCTETDTITDTDSKLGHSFTTYTSNNDATCTEDGTKTATCDHTGCTETDTIADVDSKLGHSYTNYVSDGNATCTEDGTKTATCDHTGCTETNTVTDVDSKLGHSYTNYFSNNDATCTKDGTKTATCDHSGCTETDTITDVDSKLGHSYTNYVSDGNATCTADGTKTAHCDHSGCTETDTVTDVDSKLGHSYTNYVSNNDATCTKDGTKTATCDHSGCTETDTITDVDSKLGHTFNQTVEDDKYKKSDATCTESAVYYKSCTCGECGTETFEYGTPNGHTGGTATCAQKAMCTTCGKEYGEFAAHSYAYTSVGNNTHKQTCSVCKASTEAVKCSDADGNGYCDVCGGLIYSEGLEYKLLSDGTYSVSDFGTCTDTVLVIPPTYSPTEDSEPIKVTTISGLRLNTSLKKVIIPEGVTTIAQQAFQYCHRLKEVIIPKTVTLIDTCAFDIDSTLKTVYYKGTKDEWDNINISTNYNSPLIKAPKHYYSEDEPTDNGNYWHYVDGVPTVWTKED